MIIKIRTCYCFWFFGETLFSLSHRNFHFLQFKAFSLLLHSLYILIRPCYSDSMRLISLHLHGERCEHFLVVTQSTPLPVIEKVLRFFFFLRALINCAMLESQVFSESVNNFKDDIKKIQVRSFFFYLVDYYAWQIRFSYRQNADISNQYPRWVQLVWSSVAFRNEPIIKMETLHWFWLDLNGILSNSIFRRKKYAIHSEEIEPSDFPICNCNSHEFQLF